MKPGTWGLDLRFMRRVHVPRKRQIHKSAGNLGHKSIMRQENGSIFLIPRSRISSRMGTRYREFLFLVTLKRPNKPVNTGSQSLAAIDQRHPPESITTTTYGTVDHVIFHTTHVDMGRLALFGLERNGS